MRTGAERAQGTTPSAGLSAQKRGPSVHSCSRRHGRWAAVWAEWRGNECGPGSPMKLCWHPGGQVMLVLNNPEASNGRIALTGR